MALIEVKCPNCNKTEVVKYGINNQGKQRYYCKNKECERETFILEYSNLGRQKKQKNK